MKLRNAGLYRTWLFERRIHSVPWPDYQELFHFGRVCCIMPYIRACWANGSSGESPSWGSETWEEKEEYRIRYLRADQVLDWLASIHDPSAPEFAVLLRRLLRTWLVPIDEPLLSRREVLDRRIEAIRMTVNGQGALTWSRSVGRFPDILRVGDDGLDVVHTPENDRSGLTRYLCQGWTIDDAGRLACGADGSSWGPSTVIIPHRLNDAPRRLMLGASLQTRAVPLKEPDIPSAASQSTLWTPPGRNLRAAFVLDGGFTHEDAIVISQSGADKLRRADTHEIRIRIPAIAGRLESSIVQQFKGGDLVLDPPLHVCRGTVLLQAYADLYALQWRRHEAAELGADDGWLNLPLENAMSPFDASLVQIRTRILRSTRWRLLVRFVFWAQALAPGSKLATRHGIKGVVSRILPDSQMPLTGEGHADIILSPFGILKRGAMGQFCEASPHTDGALPREGSIFAVRQPQDAWTSFRVRGSSSSAEKGQRYGEMEFWALMAHGADRIATELLSIDRSTARWVAKERELNPHAGHRALSTVALNRFLSTIGARTKGGLFIPPQFSDGAIQVPLDPSVPALKVQISKKAISGISEIIAELDNEHWYQRHGGLFALDLSENPITLSFRISASPSVDRSQQRKVPVVFHALYLLPPWLRPCGEHWHSELTSRYWKLLKLLASSWAEADPWPGLREAVEGCVLAALDRGELDGRRQGDISNFLRREVLGRRLTRSARAVIIPDPALRVDQVRIPAFAADEMFSGLGEQARRIVLVNRNPTLHRRSLLAMRPVIDSSNVPVVGLPLAVLKGMGADFDGDHVSIVALEREASLSEAESLLPGSRDMRLDPFRNGSPMFSIAGEFANVAEDAQLAIDSGSLDQVAWCEARAKVETARIEHIGDGWELLTKNPEWQNLAREHTRLWTGSLSESEWLERGKTEMEHVYLGVRRKGRFGGILRRQLYLRSFSNAPTFFKSVDAVSSITERIVQKALSVKSDRIDLSTNEINTFFERPGPDFLKRLDTSFNTHDVIRALGSGVQPPSLAAFLARPTLRTILWLAVNGDQSSLDVEDPRWSWFLS